MKLEIRATAIHADCPPNTLENAINGVLGAMIPSPAMQAADYNMCRPQPFPSDEDMTFSPYGEGYCECYVPSHNFSYVVCWEGLREEMEGFYGKPFHEIMLASTFHRNMDQLVHDLENRVDYGQNIDYVMNKVITANLKLIDPLIEYNDDIDDIPEYSLYMTDLENEIRQCYYNYLMLCSEPEDEENNPDLSFYRAIHALRRDAELGEPFCDYLRTEILKSARGE